MSFIDRLLGKQFVEAEITSVSEIKEQSFYAKATAFAMAVSYISNIISKCEIKHFVPSGNGKVKEVKDKLYYYLNISSNKNESAFDTKSKLLTNFFYDNEALMFLYKDYLYTADSFDIDKFPFGENIFKNITLDDTSISLTRRASDVMYIKLNNKELTKLVRMMLSEYEDLFKYAKTACKDAVADKWTVYVGKLEAGTNEEQKKIAKRNLEKLKMLVDKPKAMAPLYQGQKVEHIYKGSGNVDVTPIQNIRKEMFELVANAFKMPVSILYGNTTTTKDILDEWASVEIDPLCKMLSEAFTKAFIGMDDYINGERLIVDTTALFHMDWFDMCEKGDKAIGSGLYDVDEVRNKMGEEPLNTDFSKQHWMTKNYAKIEDVMSSSGNS